jgi:Uma2 family endonuclease
VAVTTTFSHGKMIMHLMRLLAGLPGVFPVSRTRCRVPDVCVYLDAEPDEEVFTTPPFLCIEVLSPEDRMSHALIVAEDYFSMGVPNVWIIDPVDGTAYECGPGGFLYLVFGPTIRTTVNNRIVLPLNAIFGRDQ